MGHFGTIEPKLGSKAGKALGLNLEIIGKGAAKKLDIVG
jgi:hypothetical protein